jgi:hypothetical protein
MSKRHDDVNYERRRELTLDAAEAEAVTRLVLQTARPKSTVKGSPKAARRKGSRATR